MSHHKHRHRSHYTFGHFVKDVSSPYVGIVHEITHTVDHGINSVGKIGSSFATPLVLIGILGIGALVINRGRLG
jgi:hypothetical protein